MIQAKINAAAHLVGLVIVLGTAACMAEKNGDQTAAPPAAQSTKTAESNRDLAGDDPVQLIKAVNLPENPQELVFKEIPVSGEEKENRPQQRPSPEEKKLVVVVKYSPGETATIIEKAKKYREPVPTKIDAEDWFPAELIAQSQAAGDEALKGKTYAADDFLKTPYTDGKLTRIDNTDYLILELFAS